MLPKVNQNYLIETMSATTGIFMVGEVAFPSDDCSPATKLWNRITKSTCVFKHYHIYFNGISIGAGKNNEGNVEVYAIEGVSLDQFVSEYPTILVRRQFDPLSPRYALREVFNFMEAFKEKNRKYTLTMRNCQKFAVDFSEHFFDVRFLSQSKLLKRFSGVVGFLGVVGYFVL